MPEFTIPVDYDDLCFMEVEPGQRFLERSRLSTQREWEHERTIHPAPEGCRVTDRVCFVPRIGFMSRPYGVVFRWIFGLRHRNLRRLFGGRLTTRRSPVER